jgi:hypothetical protein
MMRLFLRVRQNSIFRYLNIASYGIAFCLIINFVVWLAISYGFDTGYELAYQREAKEVARLAREGIPAMIPWNELRNYEIMAEAYSRLVWLTFLFLLTYLLKKYSKYNRLSLFSSILCASLLLVIWSDLRHQIAIKNPDIDESFAFYRQYNSLLRLSYFYDQISLVSVYFLLANEVFRFLVLISNIATKKHENESTSD